MPQVKELPTITHKTLTTKTIGVDLAARTARHYITCPTVDADGEVILPRGADISRFRKTGTVFDVHQYGSKDVVGRNVSLKMQDDGIIAETRFTPRPPAELLPPDAEWWPDVLLWMYHTGDISGWSVGIQPKLVRMPTKQDRERWGEGLRQVIAQYTLLEYSVAPLPSCGDALTLSAKGLVSDRVARLIQGGERPTMKRLEVQPVPPQKVLMALPAEPTSKRYVFMVPAEPSSIAPDPMLTIQLAAQLAVKKRQGRLYA